MDLISIIAHDLAETFRSANAAEAWIKVAERAQQHFQPQAPAPTLLEQTRAEIAEMRAVLEVFDVAKRVFPSFEHMPGLHHSSDWRRYRFAALLEREFSLWHFKPEKIRAAGLPWIGERVVVSQEWWSRRNENLDREVWSFRYGADSAGNEIVEFHLLLDCGLVTRSGLSAADCGRHWRFAEPAK